MADMGDEASILVAGRRVVVLMGGRSKVRVGCGAAMVEVRDEGSSGAGRLFWYMSMDDDPYDCGDVCCGGGGGGAW
jgi:hypothetical protein